MLAAEYIVLPATTRLNIPAFTHTFAVMTSMGTQFWAHNVVPPEAPRPIITPTNSQFVPDMVAFATAFHSDGTSMYMVYCVPKVNVGTVPVMYSPHWPTRSNLCTGTGPGLADAVAVGEGDSVELVVAVVVAEVVAEGEAVSVGLGVVVTVVDVVSEGDAVQVGLTDVVAVVDVVPDGEVVQVGLTDVVAVTDVVTDGVIVEDSEIDGVIDGVGSGVDVADGGSHCTRVEVPSAVCPAALVAEPAARVTTTLSPSAAYAPTRNPITDR